MRNFIYTKTLHINAKNTNKNNATVHRKTFLHGWESCALKLYTHEHFFTYKHKISQCLENVCILTLARLRLADIYSIVFPCMCIYAQPMFLMNTKLWPGLDSVNISLALATKNRYLIKCIQEHILVIAISSIYMYKSYIFGDVKTVIAINLIMQRFKNKMQQCCTFYKLSVSEQFTIYDYRPFMPIDCF